MFTKPSFELPILIVYLYEITMANLFRFYDIYPYKILLNPIFNQIILT